MLDIPKITFNVIIKKSMKIIHLVEWNNISYSYILRINSKVILI